MLLVYWDKITVALSSILIVNFPLSHFAAEKFRNACGNAKWMLQEDDWATETGSRQGNRDASRNEKRNG